MVTLSSAVKRTQLHIQHSSGTKQTRQRTKGASELMLLPHFDITDNCVPEYMHGVSLIEILDS